MANFDALGFSEGRFKRPASDDTLIVPGNLQVNGTTTTINSTTLQVDDKNIELGDGTANAGAMDGAGITVRYEDAGSAADLSSITWNNTATAWSFSHTIGLPSGGEYVINGNTVLDSTTLGSGVVSSSLTSVGTIGTGTWQGTAIADAYIASASAWNAKLDSSGAIANGDYAQFNADGDLVGLDAASVRGDLGLVIGTDVQEYSIGLDDIGGLAPNTEGQVIRWDNGATAWVLHTPTTADNALVTVDDSGVASGDYAKFTGNGIEGKTITEVKADLDVDHLITLSGVSDASDHLGTFTGDIIADNQDIKSALQDLETELGNVAGGLGTANLGMQAGSGGVSLNDILIVDGSGQATAATNSSQPYILGVAAAAADANEDVYVYNEGQVITVGTVHGTSVAVGQPVYLNVDGPSAVPSNAAPTTTGHHVIRLGVVTDTTASSMKIFYKVEYVMEN